MNDITLALRQIRQRPAGTMIILGTLSLVIGTMGLVLGIFQSERSRWMPFPDPNAVVKLWQISKESSVDHLPLEAFGDVGESLAGLELVGVMGNYGSMVLTGIGEPQSLSTLHGTAEIFDIAGVPLIKGRPFSMEEVHSGNETLAVISEEVWLSIFDRDPNVIGREIFLNNTVHEVIGVMAPGMNSNALFYGTDIWLPRDFSSPGAVSGYVTVVGRRSAEFGERQLDAELASVVTPRVAEWVNSHGGDGNRVNVVARRVDKIPNMRFDGETVFGVAIPLLVLGIASFNVANILLARMLTRRHEFAVRFSIGANRWRLIRQLVTESIVLALIAASIGLVVAYWVAQWARSNGVNAEFGPVVILGTALFALLAGVTVGWLPALRATRGDFSSDLKVSSVAAAGGGRARHRLRNVLVVGQVGMATVLCIAAGLMLRSQVKKRQFEPGFDPANMIRITVTVDADNYPDPARRTLYNESVVEQLQAIPGVDEVSMASDRVVNRYPFPIGFRMNSGGRWLPDHRIGLTVMSPNYLDSLNVPILRGRGLQATDRRGSPDVIVVNQSFADRYFPDVDPIGKTIGFSVEAREFWPTIVGVAADRPNLGRRRDLSPEGYLSFHQLAPQWISSSFVIKTLSSPGTLGKRLRETVKSVDVDLPVGQAVRVEGSIERALEMHLGGLRALGGIGLFGLLIATLGIYGVVGYSVTERRRELGIRMALGSSRGGVLRLILKQGLVYAGIGLAIGGVLAIGVTFGMEDMVYGISPFDVPTYVVVGGVLAVSAGMAALLPALRAMRIDPAHSLRYE